MYYTLCPRGRVSRRPVSLRTSISIRVRATSRRGTISLLLSLTETRLSLRGVAVLDKCNFFYFFLSVQRDPFRSNFLRAYSVGLVNRFSSDTGDNNNFWIRRIIYIHTHTHTHVSSTDESLLTKNDCRAGVRKVPSIEIPLISVKFTTFQTCIKLIDKIKIDIFFFCCHCAQSLSSPRTSCVEFPNIFVG